MLGGEQLRPASRSPSRARAWSSPGRSGGSSPTSPARSGRGRRGRSGCRRRCGLWLTSSRSRVAAGADRRVGAQRPIGRVVLAGGEQLAFILRPLLALAPLPGWVDLEERELDERPLGHARDASARPRSGSGSLAAPRGARRARPSLAAAGHDRDAARRAPTVEQIAAAVPGIAPGVLSAGLGRVPAEPDLSRHRPGQPARSPRSTRRSLPPLYVTGNRVPARRLARGRSSAPTDAPADIEPGPARVDPRGRGDPDRRHAARRLPGADRRRSRGPGRSAAAGCEPGRLPGRDRRRGRASPSSRELAARLRAARTC